MGKIKIKKNKFRKRRGRKGRIKKIGLEKQGKDKEGEKGKKISGILKKEGETFQYAVRAEMFENEAVQRGAVLTLTGLLKQVSGEIRSLKNQTVLHLSE